MIVCAIIPVKSLRNSKLRLSEVLDFGQRRELSLLMLDDVARAIRHCSKISETVLVSADRELLKRANEFDFTPLREEAERGVNAAVALANQFCQEQSINASLVIPADLPLLSPRDLNLAIELARQKHSVVISPSRRIDGTNLLLRNPCDAIHTDYEQDSFNRHWLRAIETNCQIKIYVSPTVQLDIDITEDLVQFLRIGKGTRSQKYLKQLVSGGVLRL